MCRFVLYLGPPIKLSSLITEPENSIIHQSFDSHLRSEPLNGDGFGVAWYVPEVDGEPALFRSITPAWSNRNLRSVAKKTRSPCVLAHVRAATTGMPVAEVNTHPFTWRNLAFAHNGSIGGFRRIQRALLTSLSDEAFGLIDGTTDAEHLFALVVDELLRRDDLPPAEAMSQSLVAAIERVLVLSQDAQVTEEIDLNVAFTDGTHAVACRYTNAVPETAESLFVRTGARYVVEEGKGRMVEIRDELNSVIVASEPLTENGGWAKVPANALVIARSARGVEVKPLIANALPPS